MERTLSKTELDKIDRMIELSDYAQKLIQVGLFGKAQSVLAVLQGTRDNEPYLIDVDGDQDEVIQ